MGQMEGAVPHIKAEERTLIGGEEAFPIAEIPQQGGQG